MAALGKSTTTRELMLLGYSEPRTYDAGVFEADGKVITFEAGTSMKVYVCDPELSGCDVAVMKVKSAECQSVWESLRDVGRGVTVRVEYSELRGQYRCHAAHVLASV